MVKYFSLTAIVLIVSAFAPAASFSGCETCEFSICRSMDLGFYRYQRPFQHGWVSLWPDGSFQVSKGLGLSHGSRPLPGEIEIEAKSGQSFRVALEVFHPEHLSKTITISNLRVDVTGATIQQMDNYYQITVPKRNPAEQVRIFLYVGADIEFKREPALTERLFARIRLSCLDDASRR